MPSPFDGMAGALNGIFGASVTLSFSDGTFATARGVLRELPVEIELADGRIVPTTRPLLRLHRATAARLKGGDAVTFGAKQFKVLVVRRSQSVAADALDFVELEEITA